MKQVTFKEFQESRKQITVSEATEKFGVEFEANVQTVWEYMDGAYIEQLNDGTFFLIIERSDYTAKDETELVRLEEALYEWADGEIFKADQASRDAIGGRNAIELRSINAKAYEFASEIYIDGINFERIGAKFFEDISTEDAKLLWNTWKVDVFGTPDALEYEVYLTTDNIKKLANSFCVVLKKYLDDEKIKEVNQRNKKAEDPYTCATHDFCDANEVMAEAFLACFNTPVDTNNDTHRALWNRAWHKAKGNGFEVLEKVVKEFFFQDHSGRGINGTLDEVHIRQTWDLANVDCENPETTLSDYLDNSEIGDEFNNEDGANTLTRIK